MTSLILIIGVISLITGAIFLWLHHIVREREYLVFSLICFSTSFYTLLKFTVFQLNPSSAYLMQSISMCGAILLPPFVMHLATLFTTRRSIAPLAMVYGIGIVLSLMSIFDLHFFARQSSVYHFLLSNEAVVIYNPDIGYQIFMPLVGGVLIYTLCVFSRAYHRREAFICPLLIGVVFLGVCGLYDTLWKQRIIAEPFYPMTEFGFLGLIAGMGTTLFRRLIYNQTQLAKLSARLQAMEQEESWLHENIRKFIDNKYAHSQVQPRPGEAAFLERILAVARAHLHQADFTAEEFARAMDLSRLQLDKKLRSLTGHTATQFIHRLRLDRAATLLKKNSLPISEIARQVGIPNVPYFSRCFKKSFGVTPGQYRNGTSVPEATDR